MSHLQQQHLSNLNDCSFSNVNVNGHSMLPYISSPDLFGMKLHHHYSDYFITTPLTATIPSAIETHHQQQQQQQQQQQLTGLSSVSSSSASMSSSVGQKDTTFTKIFVGGLPYHTTDKSLRQFFEAFGEIEEAVVITDRQTGKSRGYGFVTMADRESAERAVKEANPIIDGRKANVNLAYLGAKPRNNAQNGFPFPLRAGYQTVLPAGHIGLPPHHYLYPASQYLTPTPSFLLPTSPAAPQLAPTHFYDFPPTAYPTHSSYPGSTANAFDSSAFAPFHSATAHSSGPVGPAAVAAALAAASSSSSSSQQAVAAATSNVHNYSPYGSILTSPNVSTASVSNNSFLPGIVSTTTAISYDNTRMQ